MKHKLQTILKHKLQWLMLLAALLGVSQGVYGDQTYYYRGSDNSWGGTAMSVSTDGFYEYIQSSNNANQFKIALSADSWDYNYTYVTAGFNSTDVTNIGDYGKDNCYCWQSGTYYILVYYPNTDINSTDKPIICASTTLPDDTPSCTPSLSLAHTPTNVYPWDIATITATTTCTTSTLVWKLYQGANLISTGPGSGATYTFEKTDDTHYTLKGISSSGSGSSVTYTIKVDCNKDDCPADQATHDVTISAAAAEPCAD